MPEYKLKTRIQNKYKTLTEWDAIAEGTFTPLFGEVCYAVENGMLLQKIGDGTTDFTKLEWLFCQAPQADQNENDINSPAYIKNRLGYIDLGDVPADQQEMGYFENPNKTVFDTDLIDLKEDVGITAEEIGLPSSITHMVQCITRDPYLFNQVSIAPILKDTNDVYEITIGEPNNDYKFILETDNYVVGTIDDEPYPYTAFLIGNPIGANMFLQGMEAPNLMFPTDKGTECTYTVLLVTLDGIDGDPAMASVVFLGNAAEYGANDPDNIKFSLKHIKQSTVYPIDGKFLTNAQSDQFEMDTSKTSYIKNRYGDLFTIRSWELNEENDTIFTGTYTISVRNENNIKITNGVYTNNLPVHGLHGKLELYYDVISYDVEINGVVYKNCPLTTTSTLLFKGDTLYFIGNPYLINSAMELEGLAAEAPSPDYAKVCHLEDNGLPFLLIVEDLNSAKFLDDFIYGTPEWLASLTEDTISIKIGEAMMSAATHMIPPHLLPADLSFTHWLFDRKTNSIAAKSAYSASGVNAFAIGTGTKATNANCVALGDGTQATGLRAFAGGYKSVASGQNAFAFGNTTTAAGFNTTAFGSGTVAQTASQLVIGKYNILDTVSKGNNAFIIGNGTSDLRSNALTVDWNGNLSAAGSVETTSVILSSPNGTKFKVTIDDNGILSSTEITE